MLSRFWVMVLQALTGMMRRNSLDTSQKQSKSWQDDANSMETQVVSYAYFTTKELECPCCGKDQMDHVFMDKLVHFRTEMGFPFNINSAFRCESHNLEVGGAENSAHLKGRAVDINIRGEHALILVEQARNYGFSGIGVKQKGTSRFVHLDDLQGSQTQPRPWIWTY